MNKFISLYNEQSGQTTASTDRPSHQRLAQQAVSRVHHLEPVGRRYISVFSFSIYICDVYGRVCKTEPKPVTQ